MSHQAGEVSLQPVVVVDAGHQQGDGGEVQGTKSQTAKTKVNKLNCAVCKKSTKKVPANKDGAVRSGLC